MFTKFYPDRDVDSAYAIDYEELYRQGYRGIIFDIDNTLVPHGAPADQRATELFVKLKNTGFQTMLLSNNKEPRVKMFHEQTGADYIYRAGKPGKAGYQRAMERMGTEPGNTVFVGDQLFTDIMGAKKLNILSILVKPIHPKEEIQIVLKRKAEWVVLYFYRKYKRREERRRV